MDILDHLLAFAQISGGVNVKCQLHGDWFLDNPHQHGQAVAHIVSKGTAHLILENTTQREILHAGDIVFFPRSQGHCLSPQAERPQHITPTTRQQQGGFILNSTGHGQPECELFCLHFHYDPHSELMESLPEMLILHIAETPLQHLVEMLKNEASLNEQQSNLATVSMVNALAIAVLTLILREFLSKHQLQLQLLGTLKGWQEPRLRPLLKAIMQNPEETWHIEDMVALAHLSRSQLIRLFNKYLNISPHAFVHKIRLQRAAMLLKQKSDSVLTIALSTGFQSETHFSKAFKKMYGITPSIYRQSLTHDSKPM